MLDHLSLAVTDLERSAGFYDAVLGALGYIRVFESEIAIGYAPPGVRDDPFAIRRAAGAVAPPQAMHVAFTASSRDAVIRFHEAVVALGVEPDGRPELHPQYGPNYFAAFVSDPDGYRIEAVYHG